MRRRLVVPLLLALAPTLGGCGQRIGLPTPPALEQNSTNAFIFDGSWSGYTGVTDLLLTRHAFSSRLYVVSDSTRVDAYYPGTAAGLTSLARVTEVEFLADSLSRPVHIAEGYDGSIYVADLGTAGPESRVTRFSSDGHTVLGVYHDRRDSEGRSLVEWRTMEGLAVDAAGNVYVSGLVDSIYRSLIGVPIDTTTVRYVRRYSADGSQVSIWAKKGSAASAGAAAHAAGLFFDGTGLLVADAGDEEVPSRILKLSVDEPQARYPGFGTESEGFIRSVASPAPEAVTDVVADAEGYIYATDPATRRVMRFAPSGASLLHIVNQPDQVPPGQTGPDAPGPVAASISRFQNSLATMRAFVADPPTTRIIRYAFVP